MCDISFIRIKEKQHKSDSKSNNGKKALNAITYTFKVGTKWTVLIFN